MIERIRRVLSRRFGLIANGSADIGKYSVTLNRSAPDDSGETDIQVKIQSSTWELNLYVTPTELLSIAEVRAATWNDRSSYRLGAVGRMPAWWCVDGDEMDVLIGEDDETWEIALRMPTSVLDQIDQERTVV
jgi:hypothetical protein